MIDIQRVFSFFHRKSIRYFVLFLALLITLVVRLVFLMELPFAFGHQDTWSYLSSLPGMLDGGPFIPALIRVNGTYVYFSYAIFELLGRHSFHIILIQTLLGFLGGGIAFAVLKELTQSWYLAVSGLLLVSLRIRGLSYEHILLAETLYDSLGLFFLWTAFKWSKTQQYRWAFLMSLTSILEFFSRGQGIVFYLAGLGLIIHSFVNTAVKNSGKASLFNVPKVAAVLILFIFPIVSAQYFYLHRNQQYNHFHGVSAAGTYNLFWVATPGFFDFESKRYSDIKDVFRSCVQSVNRKGDDLSWGIGSQCDNVIQQVTAMLQKQYHGDWPVIYAVMAEISREAIATHPFQFVYRFLWNFHDFLIHRKSLFTTIDLMGYLFKNHSTPLASPLQIDRSQLSELKQMSSFEWVPKGKIPSAYQGFFRRLPHIFHNRISPQLFPYFQGDYSLNPDPAWTEKLMNCLSSLCLKPAVVGLVLFFTFVLVCNPGRPGRNDEMGVLLIFLFISHIAIASVTTNALYDRYFVYPEALACLQIFFGLSRWRDLKVYSQFWNAALFAGIVLGAKGLFLGLVWTFSQLGPFLDLPVLDLAPEVVVNRQAVVLAAAAVSICVIFAVYRSSRLLEKVAASDRLLRSKLWSTIASQS